MGNDTISFLEIDDSGKEVTTAKKFMDSAASSRLKEFLNSRKMGNALASL